MHPLVHSPTQTSLKSKWNSFKTWIIPDSNKRRPSQCSTTSTISNISTNNTICCCCATHQPFIVVTDHQDSTLFQKSPLLVGSESLVGTVVDKCMSPFRRRSSTASSTSMNDSLILKRKQLLEKMNEYYNLAMDEINYAEDSRGSRYYSGDLIAAKEAIDQCEEVYLLLLAEDPNNRKYLQSTIGIKISKLKSKYATLPLQDDPLSF
ncbi:uncharacterized protein BX663DRAFT_501326 [Cokeromyces recurvatus]|uniref:uncharacterized protein n=1 Tax=Cokeromyces recurvatus TaxID=90255 RepID=UPI002220971C|nr:uncharacterized protein BX663DRAFT_501326 [Cokeromyces recurvatus]KAI7905003.1 hypothetical protein BX663DRAFT_501326 [Cokeromyces recurvatus]